MRLSNDCIRDILLYIENNTDSKRISINLSELIQNLNYDENTLRYHMRMIAQAKLVDASSFTADSAILSSLSWEGHQYLDNIRDDKVWTILKDKTKNLSSVSLKVLIPVASKIIENMLLH